MMFEKDITPFKIAIFLIQNRQIFVSQRFDGWIFLKLSMFVAMDCSYSMEYAVLLLDV